MKDAVWKTALQQSADPQRARHFLDLLRATSARAVLEKCSTEKARIIVAVLSGSRALSEGLIQRPDLLRVLEPEALHFPRRKQGLRGEVDQLLPRFLQAGDDFGGMRSGASV